MLAKAFLTGSKQFIPEVPNFFGTRNQLHGRQSFHRLWGVGGKGMGMVQAAMLL